jgi:hypothetical protein
VISLLFVPNVVVIVVAVGNKLNLVVISRCSRENFVPRLLIVKLA